MQADEPQTIEAARRGDQRAFRRLVEGHARGLFQVCHRILGDAAAAEDAVQDALLNAYRGLDRFDARASFGTWLHRIAVNVALGLLRARRPELALEAVEESGGAVSIQDSAPDPLTLAHGATIVRRLGHALEHLSALERSAFVLRHVEQYSMDEVAAALSSNVNACKQAVFRAVQKLRSALAPLRSEA